MRTCISLGRVSLPSKGKHMSYDHKMFVDHFPMN